MQLSMLPTALLALIPVASAGYSYGGSGGSSSSGGSSGSVAAPAQAANGVTVINVGQNPLKMEPNDVMVPAGETIEFHFYSGAHSVAQSAFDSPCTPLNATAGNGTEGFFSGPQQVSSGEGANVFRVVSTGRPMWYYCATQRHCQNGMVGVINRPSARTITQYTSAAANAPQNVAPSSVRGGTIAQAGSGTGGSGSGSGTGTGTGSGTGTATGTGATTSQTRGSAGVGSLSSLSLPVLALAAAAAVGLTL